MKTIATLLLLTITIKGSAQTNDCYFQDTIKFENILGMKTTANINDLEGVRVIDTIDSPLGFYFEMKDTYYIAIKSEGSWTYWPIEIAGLSKSKKSIERSNIDNKKNPELILTMEYGDGRYNYNGGFSLQGETVFIYNLDTKMLMLRLDVSFSDEHVDILYYNTKEKLINIDSLAELHPGDNLDSLLQGFSQDSKVVRTKLSCMYSFSNTLLKLEFTCETTSDLANEPIASKGVKYYSIEFDKFLLKK